MKFAQVVFGLSAVIFALTSVAALADGWKAVKLRGGVLVSKDGKWVPLQLNDTIANDQVVRTNSQAAFNLPETVRRSMCSAIVRSLSMTRPVGP